MKNVTVITILENNITDYSAVRNRDLSKVKSDWVLFLDSDEQLTPRLKEEISQVVQHRQFDAYSIPRLDTFMGRELGFGEAGHTRLVRLARSNWGQWVRPVHEVWLQKGRPALRGGVGRLHYPILHHPHPSLSSFLSKINHYSTLEAEYRHQQGVHSSLFHLALFPVGKFIVNFFFKLGILDGIPGFIHALMMSFHSYLTWGKLYLLWLPH